MGVPVERAEGVLGLITEGAAAVGFLLDNRDKRYVDLAGAITPATPGDVGEALSVSTPNGSIPMTPTFVPPPTPAYQPSPAVSVHPGVHINIEIHIAADASSETVEEIFRNMRRYVLNIDGPVDDDAPSPSPNSFDPDLLRRLKEFQGRVRNPVRRVEAIVVPVRGPLSGRQAHTLARLRKQSEPLANSLEQALRDLNDHTRLSYMGPAGEVREVLRSTVQLLAPDDGVREQTWFVGITQGRKTNPSQAERTRYALQKRGGSKD